MRIPPTFVATAQRWAASWWSLGAQAGTLIFYLIMLVGLFMQRASYERGAIPASMFQGADEGLWVVSDPESAMMEWYIAVGYLGFAVVLLPLSIWVCWRMRCVLRRSIAVKSGAVA